VSKQDKEVNYDLGIDKKISSFNKPKPKIQNSQQNSKFDTVIFIGSMLLKNINL
jgi:hypothetical protein